MSTLIRQCSERYCAEAGVRPFVGVDPRVRAGIEELSLWIDRRLAEIGIAASADGLNVNSALELLVRRHLGHDLRNRGWWGLVSAQHRASVAGLMRLDPNAALAYRDSSSDGKTDRVLFPVGPAALLPASASWAFGAKNGHLFIGFQADSLPDVLEIDGSLQGLTLGLWAGEAPDRQLLVDRLRMRPWQAGGESFVPLEASARAERGDGFSEPGLPSPGEVARRWLIEIPVERMAGMRREEHFGSMMFWFVLPWPEDGAAAVDLLRRHLRFNVALFSDRCPAALDTGIQGIEEIQRCNKMSGVPHTFEVIRAREPQENVEYVDARLAPAPHTPSWSVVRSDAGGSSALGRITFSPPPSFPVRLEFLYVPAEPPPGQLAGGCRLTQSGGGSELAAEVLGTPHVGWHGWDSSDTWRAFSSSLVSRGRADTAQAVRLLVGSFDLGNLRDHVVPSEIQFERQWARLGPGLMPYINVAIPLAEDHPYSEMDVRYLAQNIQQHVQKRAAFNTRFKVAIRPASPAP